MSRLTWIAALGMTCGLLFSACGGDGREVLARNLTTGEMSTFSSEADVPPNWMVCTSADCPVPPSVDCKTLSAKVCTLNPECRLKELWCQGSGCACPACAPGATCPPCTCPPPPPPVCEYTCIPKLPLLCEELKDQTQCSARSDCEWAQGPCPMMPCSSDKPCPPCPMACRAKAPAICQGLNELQCKGRPDCEWETAACPAICIDDGKGGCLPCPTQSVCNPRTPLPPPPPPCPEIAPMPPSNCVGGRIVPQMDKNGCLIGYTCEPLNQALCSDLNKLYMAALAKAKVCNPNSMLTVQQCGKLVDPDLFCKICPTFVNIFATAALAEMDAIRTKFVAAGCDKQMIACPAIACMPPKSATCLPTAGGSGVCTNDQP